MATAQQSFVAKGVYVASDGLRGYLKTFGKLFNGLETVSTDKFNDAGLTFSRTFLHEGFLWRLFRGFV
jgi:hypothetical protein